MSDMASTIIPKSDQLNSDDLIAGPITIRIADVTIRGGQEQPISVHYEGDNGKPYKPCKSMCRVMVTAWGADSKKYVGRSMTLFRDEKVKWAGMEVGGIRISHMSDIDSALTMALTVTRANKKPFTVRPLSPAKKAEAALQVGLNDSARSNTQGNLQGHQPAAHPATGGENPPPTASAPTTAQRIATALQYASAAIKGKFAALLVTYKAKTVAELDATDQESALGWLTKQIDREGGRGHERYR